MVEVEITQEMITVAQAKANEMGRLHNSFTKGEGNIVGFLGELVVEKHFEDAKISNTYDYDIIYKGKKVDVKSKKFTCKPSSLFEVSVSNYNTLQKCEYYCFVSIYYDYSKAWIMGFYEKEQYFKNAIYHPKGDIDYRNGFVFPCDAYNMPSYMLKQDIETNDEYKNTDIKENKVSNEVQDLEKLKVLETVQKSKISLMSTTQVDEFTEVASKNFDYEFNGTSEFFPFEKPKKIPKDFNIGIIVGASGSGKSTLLKQFGQEEIVQWEENKAIVSHFNNPNEAINKLSAVGLNSIPSWVRPYSVLSTGEKFRADLSRKIKDNVVIDEFTSVVDRTVAKATSTAISKYIKKNNIKGVVFASCHYDILEWLEPDWVFDANTGILYDGRLLRRPEIKLEIFSIEKDIWEMFKYHHYLSGDLNKSAHCYGVLWEGELVGFTAILTMPSGTIKNAWRGHRTVILPDYQGMGIGTAVSDAIGELYTKQGLKYYSRSAHPRFALHRADSNKWRETGMSGKKRTNVNASTNSWENKRYWYDEERVCSSFEYVGEDYYNKEHFNILFYFSENFDKSYEYFVDNLEHLLYNKRVSHYLTFISGENKKEDTFAEKYSKEYGIRNEMFPTESKLSKGLDKLCNAVVICGENKELLEQCEKHKVPYRII